MSTGASQPLECGCLQARCVLLSLRSFSSPVTVQPVTPATLFNDEHLSYSEGGSTSRDYQLEVARSLHLYKGCEFVCLAQPESVLTHLLDTTGHEHLLTSDSAKKPLAPLQDKALQLRTKVVRVSGVFRFARRLRAGLSKKPLQSQRKNPQLAGSGQELIFGIGGQRMNTTKAERPDSIRT